MKSVKYLLAGAIVVIGLTAAAAAQSVGPPTVVALQDATAGAVVYQANCAACHQATGAGIPGTFPPLAGNAKAADASYVESVIRDGLSGAIEVDGTTYNSVMPPVALSDGDIADVVAYVATLADASSEPPPTTIALPVEADPRHGEDLFSGKAGLSNGGAACHACHAAGDVNFRGGRGLGPDLTNVLDRFGGEVGLAAWLTSPASATMQPIFDDKPLTTGEIADLTAFLGTTAGQSEGGGIDQVLIAGGIGLLVLLGLMALVIRGPNETYKQRLRRKP